MTIKATPVLRGYLVPGRPVLAPVPGNGMHKAKVVGRVENGREPARAVYEVSYDDPDAMPPGYRPFAVWAVAAILNPDGSDIVTPEWPPRSSLPTRDGPPPPPLRPGVPFRRGGLMPGDGGGFFATLGSMIRTSLEAMRWLFTWRGRR